MTVTRDRRAEAEGWGNRPDAFQPKWDIGRDQFGSKVYMLDGLIQACHFAADGSPDESYDDGLDLRHWGQHWLPILQAATPTSWIPGTPEERLGLLRVVEDFVLYEEQVSDFGGWDEYAERKCEREDCDEDCLDRWLHYQACKGASISLDPTAFEPRVRTWAVVDTRNPDKWLCICSTEASANRERDRRNYQAYSEDRFAVVPGEPV